jgi:hypothetical protein
MSSVDVRPFRRADREQLTHWSMCAPELLSQACPPR